MSVIEPLSVISYLRKDYEKNLEDSSIYKKFEKDLPAFDTKAFLFDLKNFSNSGIFYVQLMKMANDLFSQTGDEHTLASISFITFMLEHLLKNPRHYQVSVNVTQNNNKKRVIPTSVQILNQKLSELAGRLLDGYMPPKQSRSVRGSISSLSGLFKIIYNTLGDADPCYDPQPPKSLLTERIKKESNRVYKDLTQLLSRVYVHNRIREYFYNATRNVTPDSERAPRIKSVAILNEFAGEVNINEQYDYAAFTDRRNIEALCDQLRKNGAHDAFVPVASDCFGNIVAIAGSHRISLFYDNRRKLTDRVCSFIIMTQTVGKDGKSSHFEAKLMHDSKNTFEAFDDAVRSLRYITAEFLRNEGLVSLNKNNYDIIKSFESYDDAELPELSKIMNRDVVLEKLSDIRQAWKNEMDEMW